VRKDANGIALSATQAPRKPLALQILLAILWSFSGVRKRVHLQADFARLPIVPVIIAGVIAAALLVVGVLLAVRLVLVQATGANGGCMFEGSPFHGER
jgi:hypothetical protein